MNRRARASLLLFAALGLMSIQGVQAAGYEPPGGMNGHSWGDSLSSFPGIKLLTAGTALNSPGKVVSVGDLGPMCNSGACDPFKFEITQRFQGAGSHALGEYYFDTEPNPWPHKGIDVYTMSYLFCAGTQGDYLASDLKKYLKLCGTRVIFHSQTTEQLAKLPAHVDSNYQRVLRELIAEFGEPPNYARHGRVLIDPNGDEPAFHSASPSTYTVYRWCGLPEGARNLVPACKATVTFAFNETRGVGTVIYATAPVYEYAYARHEGGDENNEMYVLLNAPRLDKTYARIKQPCTGGRICNWDKTPMAAADITAFNP